MSNDIKGKGKEQLPVSSHAASAEDDDDFDELDDVLDQFKAAPLHTQASTSVTPTTAAAYDRMNSTSSGDADAADGDEDDEDFEAVFAAELAKEMEKMLGGLKPSSDNADIPGRAGSGDAEETEEEKGFREAFEKIMKDSSMGVGDANGTEDGVDLEELSKLMKGLSGGMPTTSNGKASSASKPSSSAGNAASSSQPPQSFQDTIKATMSKLAESEAGHKSRTGKSAAAGDPNDPLAALMAQMEAMGGAGGEGGEEGDLPELLDGLMDQLMSKELLYDPITELKVKYPAYVNSAEGQALPADEKARYNKQSEIIEKISDIFESSDYSDSNKETRERISVLMQQMQDAGAPPKHLLGELGPAMAMGGLGEGGPDGEACVVC